MQNPIHTKILLDLLVKSNRLNQDPDNELLYPVKSGDIILEVAVHLFNLGLVVMWSSNQTTE